MFRKLGQHFLKDARKLKKIVEAIEITPRDIIIEIGPGHGELTKYILGAKPRRVIVVERDPQLASFLKENFQLSSQPRYSGVERIRVNSKPGAKSQFAKLEIIEGDALKVLPILHARYLIPDIYKLTGNIPYYITGHLLRKISELEKKPKLVVLTIQKEVAERITAQPPHMNLLAASVQFWGEPKIVGFISKKSFRPQPKVDSAIIKIIPSPQPRYSGVEGIRIGKTAGAIEAGKYYNFIKILFKQPRKTVLNNLREGLKLSQKEVEKRLQKLDISPKLRPANLSMSDINNLFLIFRDKRV